jgi:hypothetical protein
LIEEYEGLQKIFQVKDDFDKEYYLLTGDYSPAVYLYEKSDEDLVLVERKEFPFQEVMNGLDIDNYDVIYNPNKHQWDLCDRDGEIWHKIEGTKTLYLHLDKEKPYFEVH